MSPLLRRRRREIPDQVRDDVPGRASVTPAALTVAPAAPTVIPANAGIPDQVRDGVSGRASVTPAAPTVAPAAPTVIPANAVPDQVRDGVSGRATVAPAAPTVAPAAPTVIPADAGIPDQVRDDVSGRASVATAAPTVTPAAPTVTPAAPTVIPANAGISDAVLFQAAALCLAYPDEELRERLDLIEAALAAAGAAVQFAPVLAHLRSLGLSEAQSFHIQEFDLSRRHALHLSYWTDGDTRRRGEVLAEIKAVYRDSGLVVDLRGELPDFLPIVLEFAVADPGRGVGLLQRFRASLELLRLNLTRDGVPHAGVLEAVCGRLPGKSPRTLAEVQARYGESRPVEFVGLTVGIPGRARDDGPGTAPGRARDDGPGAVPGGAGADGPGPDRRGTFVIPANAGISPETGSGSVR
ncbi:MAG: nitrate reductase molybdenum cofactor assembly chaperone [Propionicimonas sp.]|nr:nitrate reductase molybdenum cofactor assembly chaperone [Propionicimonas sp.]